MSLHNDWRLTNQERYLKGVTLSFREYAPAVASNDHDHCEFCQAKFMNLDLPGILRSGYTTADRYRWICATCFDDFLDMFQWRIES